MRERHEGDRLSAFLDDELREDESLEVTRHLRACERCLAELDEIRAARTLLRGLPNLDPPATMFQEAATLATEREARRQRAIRATAAAVGATAILGAAMFVAGGEGGGTVVPPVDRYVVDHVVQVGGGPMITPVDLGTPGR